MLLEKGGQLVTREELRARLWPAGTMVEYDQGLNAAVNRLREALGDSAEAPRFIETLPKRGYRFIAAIEPPALPAPEVNIPGSDGPTAVLSGSAGITDKPPTRSRRKVLFAAAAGLSAMLIAVTISMLTGRSLTRPPFGRQVVPFTSLPGKEFAPTGARSWGTDWGQPRRKLPRVFQTHLRAEILVKPKTSNRRSLARLL